MRYAGSSQWKKGCGLKLHSSFMQAREPLQLHKPFLDTNRFMLSIMPVETLKPQDVLVAGAGGVSCYFKAPRHNCTDMDGILAKTLPAVAHICMFITVPLLFQR